MRLTKGDTLKKYLIAFWSGLIVAILLNVLIIVPHEAEAGMRLPGQKSYDMKFYFGGRMYPSMPSSSNWNCGQVYFYVYRSVYSDKNHWIGRVWSNQICWFSQIWRHNAIIDVQKGQLPGVPDYGNDPYVNLPKHYQTWRYKSNDGFTNGDAIGVKPYTYNEWVALPWTSVPHYYWYNVWYDTALPISVKFVSGYPFQWCRNWDDMRVGVGSKYGHGGYMDFDLDYWGNGCWIGGMHGMSFKRVNLNKNI